MFLTEMILRLRAECPIFEQRVGGMAAFDKATTEDVAYAMPYAFVIPVEEEADEAQGNAIAQMMHQTYIVVVAIDNSEAREDGRGYNARTKLMEVRRQLLDALFGWEPFSWSIGVPEYPEGMDDLKPNSRADTIRYRGNSLIKMSDKRAWYQFEFYTSAYEGRSTAKQEYDRHTVSVMLEGSTAQVIDQTWPTASTGQIVRVVTASGARVPGNHYTFDPATGAITLTQTGEAVVPGYSDLQIVYEVHTPAYSTLLRKVYAQYYPTLMDLADGDPTAVTPDMYVLASEVPPDALIRWDPVNAQTMGWEPAAYFGEVPTIVEPEE